MTMAATATENEAIEWARRTRGARGKWTGHKDGLRKPRWVHEGQKKRKAFVFGYNKERDLGQLHQKQWAQNQSAGLFPQLLPEAEARNRTSFIIINIIPSQIIIVKAEPSRPPSQFVLSSPGLGAFRLPAKVEINLIEFLQWHKANGNMEARQKRDRRTQCGSESKSLFSKLIKFIVCMCYST